MNFKNICNIFSVKRNNFMSNKCVLVILFVIFTCLLNKRLNALTAKISKCHHEGDFTVYCNRSKLPLTPSDPIEYIRSAKVIYGLYHNDTLCSYVPNTSCYKKQILTECLDKTYCNVKNGWYSLEPDCAGNSYYTEFEYDCQPAYFMCDKETVVHNVFSGLIYSPSFPNTFRSDKSEACYLTLHLPKNHHVEITLEYFDMLKTSKCVGDYVEIQQYKEVNANNEGMIKLYSYKRSNNNITGDDRVNNMNSDKQPNNQQQLNRIKLARTNRRPKYKWQTLGTMCGRIDKPYTIRATADTINFKFRPLPSSHPYVASLNNYHNKNHLGFKIYFQAIPPKAPPFEDEDEIITKSNLKSTTASAVVTRINDLNLNSDQTNPDTMKPKQTFSTTWIIATVLIIIAIVLMVGGIAGFVFFIARKKMNRSKSNQKGSNAKYSKTPTAETNVNKNINNTNKKPAVVSPPKIEATISNSNKNLKKVVDDEANNPLKTPKPEPAKPVSAAANVRPAASAKPIGAGSSSKLSAAGDPDSRKMLGELPVLLQDLSQSKLLAKFKQQESINTVNNPTTTAPSTQTEAPAVSQSQETNNMSKKASITSESNAIKIKDSSSIEQQQQQQQSSKLNTENPSPQTSSKNSKSQTPIAKKSLDNTPVNGSTISIRTKLESKSNKPSPGKLTPLSSGIYGVEDSLESGVYGADTSSILAAKPIVTNNINKLKKSSSLIPTNVDLISEKNNQETNDLSNNNTNISNMNSNQNNQTTPRKTAFNPLHVILKDKNKYHTTEYI